MDFVLQSTKTAVLVASGSNQVVKWVAGKTLKLDPDFHEDVFREPFRARMETEKLFVRTLP